MQTPVPLRKAYQKHLTRLERAVSKPASVPKLQNTKRLESIPHDLKWPRTRVNRAPKQAHSAYVQAIDYIEVTGKSGKLIKQYITPQVPVLDSRHWSTERLAITAIAQNRLAKSMSNQVLDAGKVYQKRKANFAYLTRVCADCDTPLGQGHAATCPYWSRTCSNCGVTGGHAETCYRKKRKKLKPTEPSADESKRLAASYRKLMKQR